MCSSKPTSLYLTLQCTIQVFKQAYIPISGITMYIAGVQTSLHPYIWHYNVQCRCSNKPTSLYLTLQCAMQVFNQAYIPISDITMYIAGVQTSLHPYIWHYNVQFRCSNKPTSLYLTLLCSLQVFKQAYIPISGHYNVQYITGVQASLHPPHPGPGDRHRARRHEAEERWWRGGK